MPALGEGFRAQFLSNSTYSMGSAQPNEEILQFFSHLSFYAIGRHLNGMARPNNDDSACAISGHLAG